jgi:chromosome segregation ATPase
MKVVMQMQEYQSLLEAHSVELAQRDNQRRALEDKIRDLEASINDTEGFQKDPGYKQQIAKLNSQLHECQCSHQLQHRKYKELEAELASARACLEAERKLHSETVGRCTKLREDQKLADATIADFQKATAIREETTNDLAAQNRRLRILEAQLQQKLKDDAMHYEGRLHAVREELASCNELRIACQKKLKRRRK